MRKTIFAVKFNSKGEVSRKELGTANMPYNCISARKYNELKKKANKLYQNIGKGEYLKLMTDDGKRNTFGGYPAEYPVAFC